MIMDIKGLFLESKTHKPRLGAREILRYIGPGLLVTVGFIDPGNWASNIAAGSEYGYALLWMVSLSTVMLIILQHNVAHLGIATGKCLAESAMMHIKAPIARGILSTGLIAVVSTALAEILGGAIALQMLFGIPVRIGSLLVLGLVLFLLFSNTYTKIEKLIIGFVSIIGFSFLYEISIVSIDWPAAAVSWVTVSIPSGSMPIIMAVLGAVVMPHNLFLHSEIIQSRQWNKEDDAVIARQLKYEFTDTILAMLIGWAINSAMILLAAATFFKSNVAVNELPQAQSLLSPMIGDAAAIVFAVALFLSGVSSAVTAGMSGGTIYAGIFREPYDIKDPHTKMGIAAILVVSTAAIFIISDPFKGLVYSQMLLSIQLPLTVFLQVYLTSSERVMGKFRNSLLDNALLILIAAILTVLNGMLLFSALS